jgi:hypothetical protein
MPWILNGRGAHEVIREGWRGYASELAHLTHTTKPTTGGGQKQALLSEINRATIPALDQDSLLGEGPETSC